MAICHKGTPKGIPHEHNYGRSVGIIEKKLLHCTVWIIDNGKETNIYAKYKRHDYGH
jgi:hypothetical protein